MKNSNTYMKPKTNLKPRLLESSCRANLDSGLLWLHTSLRLAS
ncbi:hypothetical protein [uncultured Helicobacter sp.]|nr:hypothetical protein [uncultured Helicobacter sp.]